MRQRLKPLAAGLCILGIISTPTFAAASADDLQQQINQLQNQVHLLLAQKSSNAAGTTYDSSATSSSVDAPKKKKKIHKHRAVASTSQDAHPSSTTNASGQTVEEYERENSTTNKLPPVASNELVPEEKTVGSPERVYSTATDHPGNPIQYLPIDIDVPGQSFVSSGPYLGIPLQYSGGNLIINSPNINEDVTLLGMRKTIDDRLRALGREPLNDHPHLLLSGIVEAQAYYIDRGGDTNAIDTDSPTPSNTSDIDLTDAELDGYILSPSHWVSGLFAFTYDNDKGTDEGSLGNNSRTLNSRVFLNKAFIVLGDFNRTPFYSSFGQMYVPFGTYSSNMVSSPLTKVLARTKQRAFLVGYQQQSVDAFYASLYVFRGDAYVGAVPRINNGGINAGYRFTLDKVSGDFGGGVIEDLADSQGMQFNDYGPPQWGGFGAPLGFGNEQIAHRVHALNLRGMFNLGSKWTLLGEYVGAMSAFNYNDFSYNSHGARPWALNSELAYTFTAWDRPSTVAVGYGKTREGVALGLPLARYSAVFNTSVWKDTLQSLEFRHDQAYAGTSYGSGGGTAVTTVINGFGRPDNMVTAQFDLYF